MCFRGSVEYRNWIIFYLRYGIVRGVSNNSRSCFLCGNVHIQTFFWRTIIELLLQVIINFKEIFRILLKVKNISPLLLHGIAVFEKVYGQRFSMIVGRRALVGGGHW